jgi:PAS domain S-box-containing protein
MTDRTSRALLVVVFLFACGLVATGFAYYANERAATKETKQAELKFIAELRAGEIARWRQDRLKDARIHSSGLLKELTLSYFNDAENEDTKAKLQSRLNELRESLKYHDLILARPDGSIIMSTTPRGNHVDEHSHGALQAAIAAGDIVLGELFHCETCSELHIDVAAPILNTQNKPIAFLILRTDPEDVLFPLVQTWPTPSQSAETLLVMKDGTDAVILNALRHSANPALTMRLPLSQTDIPAVRAALGHTGKFEGNDYREVPVMAEILPVKESPWFLVAKVDKDELLTEFYDESLLILLIVVLTIAMVTALGQSIYRSRKLKLQQDLFQSEHQRMKEEQKFKALWENMAAASCIDEIVYADGKAVDYRILDINPAFERIIGVEHSKTVGRLASEAYGTPIPFLDIYAKVAETGESTSFESFFPPTGKYLQIIASCPSTGMFSTNFIDVTDRHKNTEALQVSEQKFAATFRSSPDSFFLTTVPDGRIVEVNLAGTRLFGDSAEEMIGHTTEELDMWVDPADRERYIALIRQNGRVTDFETRFRIKSGARIDATISGEIIQLHNGPHFLTVIHDIRDRKHSEKLQEKTKLRVEALLDLLHMQDKSEAEIITFAVEKLVTITDSKLAFIGKINQTETVMSAHLWSNKAMGECTVSERPTELNVKTGGLWAETIRQHKSLMINNFTDENPLKKGLPTGHVDLTRFLGVPAIRNGHAMLLAGLANKEEAYEEWDRSEVQLFLEGLLEILEKREAEKSLVSSNERLRAQENQQRAILNNIPDIAWLKDADSRFIAVNEPLAKSIGRSTNDVVGKGDFDFYPEELAKLYKADDLEVMASRLSKKVEEPYQNADGRLITIETIKTPIISENGDVVGTAGIARDITERKQLESDRQQFEIMARQQQKLESIGTLASGVAHEINNPLNVILNYGQLILDDATDQSRVKDFASNIVKESERVAVIVRNLLGFARQERETHSAARISDIVEKTLSLTSAVLRKDQIAIKYEIAEDLPSVKCRSQQIQQVLMNLLTNARDALNERFPKNSPDKTIKIIAAPWEQDGVRWVRLTVEDHGMGIPANVADKIFDPFFSTKPRNKGTGLGLSISYGIMQDHHGRLWFETVQGDGTKFHIDLRVNNGWTLGNEGEKS